MSSYIVACVFLQASRYVRRACGESLDDVDQDLNHGCVMILDDCITCTSSISDTDLRRLAGDLSRGNM